MSISAKFPLLSSFHLSVPTGGQDRADMLGKALARGREPHASSLGLDQLRAGFVCQGGDLLRHARCGDRQDVAGVVTAASEPSTWPSRQLSPEIQAQFTKRWLRNDPEHVVHPDPCRGTARP